MPEPITDCFNFVSPPLFFFFFVFMEMGQIYSDRSINCFVIVSIWEMSDGDDSIYFQIISEQRDTSLRRKKHAD